MALTTLDKYNFKGLIKKSHISRLRYSELIKLRGKSKFTDGDMIQFFKEELENRFNSNSNIIDKHICKYLFCITSVIVYNFEYVKNLSQEALDDAHLALDMCIANIECGNEEDRAVISGVINTLNSKLIDFGMIDKNLYSKTKNPIDSCVDEMKNAEKIREFKREITSLKKTLKGASDEIAQRDAKIKLLEEKVSSLENEKGFFDEKVNALNSRIEHYKTKLEEVSSKLSNLDEDAVNELNEKIKSLSKIIEIRDRTLSVYVSRDNKEKYLKDVENKVIMLLSASGYTFDELYNSLKKEGYSVTECELRQILINVNKILKITDPNRITSPIVYRICSPNVIKNANFEYNLSQDVNSLDIMVISDLHLFKIDGLKRNVLNSVYEYCSKFGIKLILNLGDFTDYNHYEDSTYSGVCYGNSILERMIEDFPYDKNITHALLGGNHDAFLFGAGIDFLSRLEQERNDFVSLGYEHASISFNPKSKIMLHHMDIKVPEAFDKDEYNVEDLVNKIKNYYKKNNLNRSDYYLDLLGHFHKSSLDLVNGIGTLPSLFKDRVFDGAWHLRIYFNQDKSIKHIVIIPLIRNNRKLVPNGEINYQRLSLKR